MASQHTRQKSNWRSKLLPLFIGLFLSSFTHSVFAQSPNPDYSQLTAVELEALADKGDMHAVFTQGYNLIFDSSQEELTIREDADFKRAKVLLETAHANGHNTANSILMLYYQGDFGHEPNPEKLEALLTTSSESGNNIARLNYAVRFIESEDIVKSKTSFEYLIQLSQNEVTKEATYPYLIETLYGINTKTHQDWPLAREKSVECSKLFPENTFCHYILGRDFEQGWGGEKDLPKSDFHFKKAAELGDSRAQWTVGMLYLNGTRVEKNEKTAFEWVKKSAEQDYLEGLISYAVMNALGEGTDINTALSFETYETAASLGSAHALRSLSSMYCAGEAPKTDRNLCAAGLILAYEGEDDHAAKLLNHFFSITEQAEFDALKKKTAPSRATLISRYNIQI